MYNKITRTSVLNPGAGFLRIFIISFDRLGFVRVNDCPAGLGPPAGAKNRRKATVTKRRNTAPGFNTPDPDYLQLLGAHTSAILFCEHEYKLSKYSFSV